MALEYGGGILLNALLGRFRVCVGQHYNSPKRSLMLDLSASNLDYAVQLCLDIVLCSEARH